MKNVQFSSPYHSDNFFRINISRTRYSLYDFSHTSKKSLTCKVWRPFYFCRRNSLLSSIFSTVSQARSFYFLTRYCQQSLKQKNQKSTTNTPSKNNFEQNIIFCVDILIGPMGHTNKTEQNIALNFDLRKNSSSLYKKNER